MSKILLVCFVSPEIGIGHLSRLLVLADSLKKDRSIVSEFLIFGDLIKKNELATYNVHNFSLKKNFGSIIENILDSNSFDALVFDLYPKHNINNLGKLFYKLKQLNICIISIDSLIEYCNIIDLIWVPSFNFDCTIVPRRISFPFEFLKCSSGLPRAIFKSLDDLPMNLLSFLFSFSTMASVFSLMV